MKNPHDIIKRPILTEKAYEGIDEKRYVFEVKMKRQGRTQGMTPETKKAYVILKKDSKPIKFFEGMAQ